MNTPKLDSVVEDHIFRFPTLYRRETFEDSKIYVLGHMFLSYGTGLEWSNDTPRQIIYEGENADGSRLELATLPDGYFDMSLYTIVVENEHVNSFEQDPRVRSIMSTEPQDALRTHIIFTPSDGVNPGDISSDYGYTWYKEVDKRVVVREARCKRHRMMYAPDSIGYIPGIPCKYSPIDKIRTGKVDNVHPEWLVGAKQIAQYTIEFLQDPERFKYHHYYPAHPGCIRSGSEEEKYAGWNDLAERTISEMREVIAACEERLMSSS